MKRLTNTIRFSFALSASAVLLAACQERGTFKAYRATPKEKAEYEKTLAGGAPKTPAGGPAQGPAPIAGGPTATPVTTAPTPITPSSPFKPVDGAAGKLIWEKYAGDRNEMVKESDFIVKQGLNGEAARLIKGLTVVPVTAPSREGVSVALTVRAHVLIGGKDERFVHLENAPATFPGNAKVFPLRPIIRNSPDGAGADIVEEVGVHLLVSAFCGGIDCRVVFLRFDFKVGSGNTPVILRYDLATDRKSLVLVASNIGDANTIVPYEKSIVRPPTPEEIEKAEQQAREEAKKKSDDEAVAKKKAEDEAAAKKKAEEDTANSPEERAKAEAKKKADDEAVAKKKAEDEAAAKKKAEEDAANSPEERAKAVAKKKAEDEAAAKKKTEDEATAKKSAEEIAAKKKAETVKTPAEKVAEDAKIKADADAEFRKRAEDWEASQTMSPQALKTILDASKKADATVTTTPDAAAAAAKKAEDDDFRKRAEAEEATHTMSPEALKILLDIGKAPPSASAASAP